LGRYFLGNLTDFLIRKEQLEVEFPQQNEAFLKTARMGKILMKIGRKKGLSQFGTEQGNIRRKCLPLFPGNIGRRMYHGRIVPHATPLIRWFRVTRQKRGGSLVGLWHGSRACTCWRSSRHLPPR